MGSFFIDRPVFAWVLAIVTMLTGVWSITTLPVSQYPDIAPTTVRISATYSGATAEAVENSVTRIIEDSLTGIDGLLYMISNSRKGSASIELVFDESVQPIDAQNDVQTRVAQIESQLPTSVQSQGLNIRRSSDSILMVGALVSTDGKHTTLELGNLLEEVVENPIRRTEGVGGINSFGSGYAMRIWLDPLSLARYQLTPSDVVAAVKAQNTTVSVGSLGDQPTSEGQQFTATLTAQSQLSDVSEFKQILLKTSESGGAVYLGDVARVEIGQEDYGSNSRFNGMPAAGFGINLATGANAVDTAAAVRSTMDKLAGSLPDGVEVRYAYDTSPFVEMSINQVYQTLIEAVVLVVLVLLVFLQSLRATFVPLAAVPVVLFGTLAVLAATGFTINTLTMFAMVLAIGLLVDDAIVVVENVERLMEEGVPPMEATRQSMGQITSALIGIVVVLSAVFLPMAFFGGSTGVIYRQFSITMIAAMVLSLLVALTLSAALCAHFLKPGQKGREIAPARWFNKGFDAVSNAYAAIVRQILKAPARMLLVLAIVMGGAWMVYEQMNSSFLPTEDQGALMTMIRLPEGSTYKQTLAVVDEFETYLLNDESEAIASTFTALGFGFGGNGQNQAMMFIKLKDFDDRKDVSLEAGQVANRINMKFATNRQAEIFVMQPPAIMGLGNSGGFSMYLTSRNNASQDVLSDAARELIALAKKDPRVSNIRASNNEDESALRIMIDQQKAESFGVTLSDINSMLSVVFSGTEVNDFVLGGNLRPVIVQAEEAYRMQPEDIDKWYIRNSADEMVPFSAFITTKWEPVAPSLARFGGVRAIQIDGSAGDGVSSGQAMNAMEELAAQLPGGYGVEWTGLSYQERQSGQQAPMLYALSILIVFLALAALYESWSVPISVMLVVPVGVMGALLAAWLLGQSNDVYFKVGILTTIGLAARNAILIVEFAETLLKEGESLIEAAVQASVQRLRPIMMTALTFILGVLPLAVATGAGANAQNAIGIGVIGGMIASTFIGILMVPALYVIVRKLADVPKQGNASA
ncbi:efflux RND transporter permease subunit [Cohaesibacter haloalkalitolerans]|uniref:efflux RND transporter permease subunit n=1 Tax=Cohaesibacter haloalkalitolerans TaxID=1162980 RepID=UPI000E6485F1|nr:efflux RND transporter permease subunit [Cohaesibacter haloalkalitolerans]